MNKLELTKKIVQHTGLPIAIVERVLNGFFLAFRDGLKEDGYIMIRGIGAFEVVKTPGRHYTLPQGTKKYIPEKKRVVFRVAPKTRKELCDVSCDTSKELSDASKE